MPIGWRATASPLLRILAVGDRPAGTKSFACRGKRHKGLAGALHKHPLVFCGNTQTCAYVQEGVARAALLQPCDGIASLCHMICQVFEMRRLALPPLCFSRAVPLLVTLCPCL